MSKASKRVVTLDDEAYDYLCEIYNPDDYMSILHSVENYYSKKTIAIMKSGDVMTMSGDKSKLVIGTVVIYILDTTHEERLSISGFIFGLTCS